MAISRPTQSDLIPATTNQEHDPERDNVLASSKKSPADDGDALQTLKPALNANRSRRPAESLLSDSTTEAPPPTQPSGHPSGSRSLPKTHIETSTLTVAGHKRSRDVSRLKSTIHKPFKSPIRSLDGMATTPAPKLTHTCLKPVTPSFSGIGVPTAPQSLIPSQHVSFAVPRVTGDANKVKKGPINHTRGKRIPFRSPITLDRQSRQPSETDHARLIELQTLNSRIIELQSSIRKAKQVIQLQQKQDDIPLLELIEKWKRASQEGAQTLIQKYTEQEQVFGTWDDDKGSSYSRAAPLRRHQAILEDDAWGIQPSSSFAYQRHDDPGVDLYNLQRKLDAEESRLEIQDVEQDLPTVDEAIRCRTWPDVGMPPVTLTKMQKLLMGLGINPAVIGYDPEQDGFTTDDLSNGSL